MRFCEEKNAAPATAKTAQTPSSATRRKRPLCPILRRAILLPRAPEPSLPVCLLPSQALAQWLTFVTRLSPFRCFLALTVPFAVGFSQFLSGRRLTPQGLCSDSRATSPDPYSLSRTPSAARAAPGSHRPQYTPPPRSLSTAFRRKPPRHRV